MVTEDGTGPGRPPRWLSEAVLYQIYPQSFADSNSDGIGDLAGITARLDYLVWLGVNVLWLNPCFVSPFRDGGYDISDFLTIAPRYGNNEDLATLVSTARTRGIRVMLDLVAGHTSERHPWFQGAADDPGDDRYIWSTTPGPGFIPSPGQREGFVLTNFLPCQPALNFGYARAAPGQPWRQPVDAPGPQANREAIRKIMAHWLDLGISGFRCDMAYSLVKDDPGYIETGRLWREMRQWLQERYPEAVLIAEWGQPEVSVPAGFHADFFLHFMGDAMRSLWDNGTGVVRPSQTPVTAYFDQSGHGSGATFVDAWQQAASVIAGRGHVALPTANHDFSRLACGHRTGAQLAAAFALQMTWPTLPVIYYGDEIGMRFIHELPDVEGSRLAATNNRAGSRTPMQWDDSTNAGFSTTTTAPLYLPLDPDPARPTIAAQQGDPRSLLHTVRHLIALRKTHPGLGTGGDVQILNTGYPLAYVRADTYLVVINPRREPARLPLGDLHVGDPLLTQTVTIDSTTIIVAGYGFGIYPLVTNDLPASDAQPEMSR